MGPIIVESHISSESSKKINQVLVEETLIKTGDWIRATTIDGEIHEFSFVGITEDTLHGGDVALPSTEIYQIDVFPLLRSGGRNPVPRLLINDEEFDRRLFKYSALKYGLNLTLSNGDWYIIVRGYSIKDEMIIGKGLVLSNEDHYLQVEDLKIPTSSVAWVEPRQCEGNIFYLECVHDSFHRWNHSKAKRIDLIEKKTLLREGDWVRITLTGGKIQEFQYQELKGDLLVGGDGSANITEIKNLEIYSAHDMERSEEIAGGAAVAIVALAGFTILLWGMGIPVPPMVP